MTWAAQTFVPVMPRGLSHNLLEAYTYKRDGKVVAGIRKSQELKDAEDAIRPFIERAAPPLPLDGPVTETIKLCYAIGRTKHENGEPYLGKPDADNAVKVVNDICQGARWVRDDKQIWRSSIVKVWATYPGIFIRFECDVPVSHGDGK